MPCAHGDDKHLDSGVAQDSVEPRFVSLRTPLYTIYRYLGALDRLSTPNQCRHLTVSHFGMRGIFPMEKPRPVSRSLASDKTQARLFQCFVDLQRRPFPRLRPYQQPRKHDSLRTCSSLRMIALEPRKLGARGISPHRTVPHERVRRVT